MDKNLTTKIRKKINKIKIKIINKKFNNKRNKVNKKKGFKVILWSFVPLYDRFLKWVGSAFLF